VKITGSKFIRDAQSAVLEPAVPDVPVKRIEILDADCRLGAAVEATSQDGSFCDAIAHAGLNPYLHVLKNHVGDFIGNGPTNSSASWRAAV
jgi:hypothetical protein